MSAVAFTDGSAIGPEKEPRLKTPVASGGASIWYINHNNNNLDIHDYEVRSNGITAQAGEVEAIRKVLKIFEAKKLTGKMVIFTDSLSTLYSLYSPNIRNEALADSFGIIDKLNVKLHYVPAHQGVAGNERADSIAKRSLEAAVKEALRATKTNRVLDHGHYVSLIKNTVTPVLNHGFRIVQKSNLHTRILSRYVTEANGLKKHLFQIAKASNPLCDTCKVEETAHHVLEECLRFTNIRTPPVEAGCENYLRLKIERIVNFFSSVRTKL